MHMMMAILHGWQQEAEAATMSIARRAASDASSTQEAIKILRGNWLLAIEQHHIQYSESSVINDILDIGCSIGISTRYLADKFLTAKVTGLDLSPYFLAVAKHKEKRAQPRKFPIRWIHANGEDTGLPSKSFNLVSIAFVFHECHKSYSEYSEGSILSPLARRHTSFDRFFDEVKGRSGIISCPVYIV
ncbi:hypothetical protein AAZV13_12G106101 [Glycine max]